MSLILVILQVLQISEVFFLEICFVGHQEAICNIILFTLKSLHCFLNVGHLAITYHDGLSIFLSSYWEHILITLNFKSDSIEKLNFKLHLFAKSFDFS